MSSFGQAKVKLETRVLWSFLWLFFFNLGSVASLFVFGAEGFGVRGFVPFGNHGETSCRCRTAVASER